MERLLTRLRLRTMLLLVAVLPLLLATGAVVWVVARQSQALQQTQAGALEGILRGAREDELKHFVQVARHAVDHLRGSGRDDAALKREALELLRRLDFGDDNYFFVYDLDGVSLMHPRLPQLEGKSQWALHDAQGSPVIQRLIAQARQGGGFVEYLWNRPSTGRDERKIGYVELVPEWGWMIGTGLYLDHLAQTQALIRDTTRSAVTATRDQILAIAVVALAGVAAGGLALNHHEQRSANVKLQAMAAKVVASQEEERARVARELHDSVSQWLASVKFRFESALALCRQGSPDAPDALRVGLRELASAMKEVRRISHALRPTVLDDLGLGEALAQMAREFGSRTGIQVHPQIDPQCGAVPGPVATTLFRICQEALHNVERHAQAHQVTVRLDAPDGSTLRLQVHDDGRGFDAAAALRGPRSGLGLSSMRERAEMLGGRLAVGPGAPAANGRSGTRVTATVPRDS